MRLLLFSDIHVDGYHATRGAFTQICGLADDLRVDAVCCAGNLFDRATATEDTIDFLREGFAGLDGIPVFIAPGSTDWTDSAGPYERPHYWSPNVRVFTRPQLELFEFYQLKLWGAAHVAPEQTTGFLEQFRTFEPGINVALFHGCELSVSTPPLTAPFSADQVAASGLRHALVGHLAEPHWSDWYAYAGRPALTDRAQAARGGAMLVQIDLATESVRHELRHLTDHPDERPTVAAFPTVELPPTFGHPVPPTPPLAPPPRPRPPEPTRVEPLPTWLAELLEPAPDDDERAADHTVRAAFLQNVEHSDPVVRRLGLRALDGDL
jgi:DNA repair protein SbcD/Mre11